jgi:hypothetical protein
MKKFHSIVGEKPAHGAEGTQADDPSVLQIRADDKEAAHAPVNEVTSNEEAKPSDRVQSGVKKIEAVTLAWTRATAFTVLVLYVVNHYPCCMYRSLQIRLLTGHLSDSIWFLTLVNDFRASIVTSLNAYATSSFQGHSLLTVINIVTSVMGGSVYIPMAKALDVWGRAEGFLLMTFFCILGLVLLASSQDLPTYCAGQVRYNNQSARH